MVTQSQADYKIDIPESPIKFLNEKVILCTYILSSDPFDPLTNIRIESDES